MTLETGLRKLLGDRLISDARVMAAHLVDERDPYSGTAACMVLPETSAEVATVVRLCAQHDHSVVPQGGNTG